MEEFKAIVLQKPFLKNQKSLYDEQFSTFRRS